MSSGLGSGGWGSGTLCVDTDGPVLVCIQDLTSPITNAGALFFTVQDEESDVTCLEMHIRYPVTNELIFVGSLNLSTATINYQNSLFTLFIFPLTLPNQYGIVVQPLAPYQWREALLDLHVTASDGQGNCSKSVCNLAVSNPVAEPPCGPTDVDPPVIGSENPPCNSTISGSQQISVDITDMGGGIQAYYVVYDNGSTSQLAFDSTTGSMGGFSGFSTAIADGFRVSLLGAMGWLDTNFTLRVIAVDSFGNISEYLCPYTVDPPPVTSTAADSTPPVVSNFSPAPGTPINKWDEVKFDVTDDSGAFRRVFIVAECPNQGRTELIHDGDSFFVPYSPSSRTTIASGYNYCVRRTGGWHDDQVIIRVYAIDLSGNEG